MLRLSPAECTCFRIRSAARRVTAIYTQHLAAIHIIRKVILRVGAKLNYIIPKLH